MKLPVALSLVVILAGAGCTAIDTTRLPSDRGGGGVFVTAGDIPEPHDVLGLVQVSRSGVLLFGFIDVIGTDLDAGFKDVLIPHIEQMGGDGAVRARFHMTQYTPVEQVVGAILFFVPLPREVTITAQVVKLRQEHAPPRAAAPKPPAEPPATAPVPPPVPPPPPPL